MKRTLTFEFEADEPETFSIIANSLSFHDAISDFETWLRSKFKHGFSPHENEQFDGLTSHDAAAVTIGMVREALHDYIKDRI